MKKLLCLLLAMTMLVGSLFVLSACDKKDEKESEESVAVDAPEVPAGYKLYENDYIYFVYPENWETRDMSGITVLLDAATGNNITLAYEIKSDLYKTMDLEKFNSTFVPVWKQQGMTVSNIQITNSIENALGYEISKFTFNATQSGQSMKQEMYIIPSGGYNYVVNVTQGVGKEVKGLAETVFNSLTPKQ